jgi:NADH dehydrogenase [ubiquinone] 1 alpha subcomplex assembly factor 1
MYLLITLLFLTQPSEMTLFYFTLDSNLSDWATVDDTVMGGRSDGNFGLNEAGHGEYTGHVSVKNNGGFSSLRYGFPTMRSEGITKAIIRLKGDGNRYQFRVKSQNREYQSYVTYIETSGEWEEVEVTLADLKPQFRGRQLNMPDYPGELLSEIRFLIGNKKEQDFKLELDWIKLK